MSIPGLLRRLWHPTDLTATIGMIVMVLSGGLVCAPPAYAAGLQVNAAVHPSRISLDAAARLVITARGAQLGEPALPKVDGLTFRPLEQSSRLESVNGAVTSTVSRVYQVTASRAGIYTIPAIEFLGAMTTPLVLEVVPPLPGAGGTQGLPGASLPPPPLAGASAQLGTSSAEQAYGRDAFVRMIAPKQQLYVGELMPVEFKAYFRSDVGVSLDGPPVVDNDAFTISNLTSTPLQSQESIDGIPYTVLSWSSGLVPVRNGSFSMTFQLPVKLQIEQRVTSDQWPDVAALLAESGLDSTFLEDSGLKSLLGGIVEKPVTLKAPETTFSVLSLPSAGRPAGYSGAVGSFDVRFQAMPAKVALGDPLTVTLSVEGQGNFDRVSSSEVPSDAAWKAYRPDATFAPQDSVGLRGIKKFDQTIVPLQPGELHVPSLEFSYFDPKLREYVTRRTAPIAIEVSPGQAVAAKATVAAGTYGTSGANGVQPVTAATGMASVGRFVPSLRPIIEQTWFLAVPAIPLAVLAGGFVYLHRRERLAGQVTRAGDAADAEVAAALGRMDIALEEGDGAVFVHSARHALEVRLAKLWAMVPSDVNRAQLDARLDSSWDPVRELFSVADQAAYGGTLPALGTLTRWRAVVHNQLDRLGQV
jgi:hypothetical protein